MTYTQEAGPSLFRVYQALTLAECVGGVLLSAVVVRQWLQCYHKVTPLIQAYILVFVPDCITCLLYLGRSIYSLYTGGLYTGPGDMWWCKLAAYLTIAGAIALAFGVVCISFAILSMLRGQPVPDKLIVWWGAVGWVCGLALASIFAGADLLGPYKNLYCLCEVPKYRPYGTAPVLITVIACLTATTRNYAAAFRIVRSVEQAGFNADHARSKARWRASSVIFSNAANVIGTYVVSWILIFVNAAITALGGRVPIALDVVASLLAKFQPISDALHLHHMLSRIMKREGVHGGNAKVAPGVPPQQKELENQAYNRLALKEEAAKPEAPIEEEEALPVVYLDEPTKPVLTVASEPTAASPRHAADGAASHFDSSRKLNRGGSGRFSASGSGHSSGKHHHHSSGADLTPVTAAQMA